MGALEALGLLGLGLLAGGYGVLVGAGGGFILAPLLILVWKMPPALAVGTSLAVVLVNSLSGALGYARARCVDYRSGILFALAAIPGSVLGALWVRASPPGAFRLAFGALLLALGGYLLLSSGVPRGPGRPRPTTAGAAGRVSRRRLVDASGTIYEYQFQEGPAVAANALFGFLSSFFGVGGGFLRTPLLVYVFHFPVRVAAATSILAMSIYTGVGVLSHGLIGNIAPWTFLLAGAGVVLGSQVGVALSGRLRGPWVVRLLAVALVAVGVRLLVEAVTG